MRLLAVIFFGYLATNLSKNDLHSFIRSLTQSFIWLVLSELGVGLSRGGREP